MQNANAPKNSAVNNQNGPREQRLCKKINMVSLPLPGVRRSSNDSKNGEGGDSSTTALLSAQIAEMHKTQEATIEALGELNRTMRMQLMSKSPYKSVRNMALAQRSNSNPNNLGGQAAAQSPGGKTAAAPPPEEDDGPETPIERSALRLDGLEVYAVVAALTIATSIACFDSFPEKDFGAIYAAGAYRELIGDAVFLIASAVGIISGLHATLVFSLMTMYGRTAVGLDRDAELEQFFAATGGQRFRGFQTFLLSLYTFLVQVAFMVTSKCPENFQSAIFIGCSYCIYRVHQDCSHIISAAGILFVPRQSKCTSSSGDGGGKDAATTSDPTADTSGGSRMGGRRRQSSVSFSGK